MESKIRFENPPVIIMGAMDCETDILAESLENSGTYIYGNCRFTEGFLDGYPAVVVKSLMGMVNASVAAVLAIDTYKPKCIICQGTSGAHNPDLHQGDIILGENIIENCGYYTAHRDEGEGLSDLSEWRFPGKEILVNGKPEMITTFYSDKKLLETADKVPYSMGKIKHGTVSSGDIWNKEADRLMFYHNTFGSDCEEMEGFAVAQVCAKFNVPLLLIRIISNSEFHPEEAFNGRFGEECQRYCLDVARIISSIF